MAGTGRSLLRRRDSSVSLAERLQGLQAAAELSVDRVDPEAVAEAERVVQQAGRRLALSGGATVVALAGATGSGKSSTFNALAGVDLATVGVRRPTTSQAMAATWGAESTEDLVEWLQIPRRHAVEAQGDHAADLDGLVLLDLPDHDSTQVEHRLEVDRLVQLVDLLVWVVDPQKYADAALHERYLRPLSAHADVMLVVLNQIDRLTAADRDRCLVDLHRLLAEDGLARVEVLGVSSLTGAGLPLLRRRLSQVVAAKTAAVQRLTADLRVAADRLGNDLGAGPVAGVDRAEVDRLDAGLADAAGTPVVVEAVGRAWRLRGGLATGWPVLSWLARFRPDPLRRLHLDRLGVGGKRAAIEPSETPRTSLPARSGVQRARVDTAVRGLADTASAGLGRGWVDAVRGAARASESTLADQLDRAVATTDLDLAQHRRWWQAVRVLQWVLFAALVAGLLWLGSAFVLLYLQLPPLPRVRWWGLPAPTVLTAGGVLAGLIVAGLARIGVEVGARRRVRQARRSLRRSISRVSQELVVRPVEAELERCAQARAAVDRARS